jgi:hypothetical protein
MIPYVVETVRGKVKPERVSWFVWTLLGATYLWTAIIEDGAVLFTTGELIGPLVAFILALKYGVGGRSKVDITMLVLALVAIVCLLLFENTMVSLILALVADGIASFLTIRKLHIDPSSESRWAWGFFALSALFAIVSLTTYSFETLAFPVYLVTLSVYITFRIRRMKEPGKSKLEEL